MVDTPLAWTAGSSATSHDVYFGTNSIPDAGEFQGNEEISSAVNRLAEGVSEQQKLLSETTQHVHEIASAIELNARGRIAMIVSFTDGSQAVVQASVRRNIRKR